jgi:hypothetical protein
MRRPRLSARLLGGKREVGELKSSIASMLNGWSRDDLGNLGALLQVDGVSTAQSVEERFKWLYHSRSRAVAESAIRNAWKKVTNSDERTMAENLRSAPSYMELLRGACAFARASEEDATVPELELFISHSVIIAALQRMTPRERLRFFHDAVDLAALSSRSGLKGPEVRGPVTTFAALGAVHASGFGIFLASSTALGFLTHALGITLPFAAYAGLSSTIASAIGPLGWLSAGLWGAWKLTEPEWKSIVPGLVYMIAVNSRRQLRGTS